MPTSFNRLTNASRVLLELARPLNMLLLFAGTLVGGVLAVGLDAVQWTTLAPMLLAGASVALIGGAANGLNDVYDAEVDAVNRPGRPVASGRISAGQARLMWAAASSVGLVLAFLLSPAHGALALGAIALLVVYNIRLKRLPLVGNVTVALLAGLVLVYGSLAVSHDAVWIGAAFAFLTTLAREIIKDIEDVRGDAAVSARTLPLVAGAKPASLLACGVLAFTVILTPVPYLYFGYAGVYLLPVVGAAALLFHAAWLIAPPAKGNAGRASGLCKGGMALGLAALAVAALP